MSSVEVDAMEVGEDPHLLTVEGYDEGYYSAFWPTETDYEVPLEFYDRHPPSSDASATVKPSSAPESTVPFNAVRNYLSGEIELLRVDDHDYAVTWQGLDGPQNRVGFISVKPHADLLLELYHQSTQVRLPTADRNELDAFLSNY